MPSAILRFFRAPFSGALEWSTCSGHISHAVEVQSCSRNVSINGASQLCGAGSGLGVEGTLQDMVLGLKEVLKLPLRGQTLFTPGATQGGL